MIAFKSAWNLREKDDALVIRTCFPCEMMGRWRCASIILSCHNGTNREVVGSLIGMSFVQIVGWKRRNGKCS